MFFNPLSWRSLADRRFVFLFFPFLVYLIAKNFSKKVLSAFSLLFIVSGFFYIFSFGVIDGYTPPIVDKNNSEDTYFQNVSSFTSTYFYSYQGKINYHEPVFLTNIEFEKFCKSCFMGSVAVSEDINRHHKITVVGLDNYYETEYFPKKFSITRCIYNLSPLDSFLWKYLTPVYTRRYATFELEKIEEKRL
jgi:hypothetical protein